MAGGRGERFWPQSRLKRPKHLLPIVGDKPMLAQTIERLDGLVPPERILVITNVEQRAAVREVCPQLPAANVIGEPVGRDTAAAVGLAVTLVKARNPQAVVAMLPADAAIHDHDGFRRALSAAFAAARQEPVIVTLGIPPTFPATGYGYIENGEVWQSFDGIEARRVTRFVEKPDRATAEGYLAAGNFTWNAGMFIFAASAVDDAFARHTPALHAALSTIGAEIVSGDLDTVLAAHYPSLEKISVDYAIMEPASAEGKIVTLPAVFDWDDVGEWSAIARHLPGDGAGNTVRGNGVVEGGTGNIVVTEPGHTVALLGVDDLIVVQTADATLVCPKSRAQDIKALVKKLTGELGRTDLA